MTQELEAQEQEAAVLTSLQLPPTGGITVSNIVCAAGPEQAQSASRGA